ncbi:amidohydrolase family protein [Trichothermofontia sichuanensis B231]|uniref:amidohydrolase family protein n=1 Tax=Trichothermofontia sichuanensis TaxID=3045816 RepID=UPI00224813EF|nr:amidohydrolase family protein [Trichothermofontia sichuanensis]UZQ55247.1 amidohydrolase family protein [Trichothermofontia sichuanensis B231]
MRSTRGKFGPLIITLGLVTIAICYPASSTPIFIPVQHYGLPVGLLQVGDPADLIVVTDLEDFAVQQTYCRGQLVAEQGRSCLPFIPATPINHFAAQPITLDALRIPARGPIVRVGSPEFMVGALRAPTINSTFAIVYL